LVNNNNLEIIENKQKFTVSFLRKMNIPDDVQLENYIVIKDR